MPTQVATVIQDGEPFLIGNWRVEPTLNRLSRDGESIQLEHKAMDVLLCLVECAGNVVSKHDLLDAVWQTEFVSDNSLQRRIADLREAFGDDAKCPRYIETIRKRGYRLIAEVAPVDARGGSPAPPGLRTPEAQVRDPYPGLAAFTEADADVFFGREREITALWRRIASRRLLAVIGPSGIGKSSLLRAGVAARSPPGWRVLVLTPGEDPTVSLARALAPDLAGDPSAVSRLVGFNDPDIALAVVSRWRGLFDEAVLVVDQFEELFTLSTADAQARFIELLRRLVDAADVHVVISMRDDFLHRCQPFSAIAPVFDSLTVLGPPGADALRRAITEPAVRLTHRFESETLVDRMITEVEDQRAALPLLAFALRRLWDTRDRARRVLTEESFEAIGGVAGALARRAEEVIAGIGRDRLPIVREIFRNLVTAEGTRAVRETDELLSVFDETQRPSAEGVLRELIGARLLTSFNTSDDEGSSERHVEIVHESLLDNWPRLARWRTQDREGAQLRDELRHAARSWNEHGRPEDRLWTETAYREFRLWRERYPGGLSQVEEAFAEAMAAFSTRRRRRRRLLAGVVLVVAVVVGAVTTTLWRRSVAETRRAEAGKLLALGQKLLEDDPTAALAYTRASLELADTPEARRFAVEVLWHGPVARIMPARRMAVEAGIPTDPSLLEQVELSPDGRWLAVGARSRRQVLLFPSDGGPARAPPRQPDGTVSLLGFGPGGELITGGSDNSMVFWSLPELSEIRSVDLGGVGSWGRKVGDGVLSFTRVDDTTVLPRIWPLFGGEPEVLAFLPGVPRDIGSGGAVFAHRRGRTVLVTSLEPSGGLKERVAGEAGDVVKDLTFNPEGDRVASLDQSGELRVWSTTGEATRPLHVFRGPPIPFSSMHFDPAGRLLTQLGQNNEVLLWDLESPPDTEPRVVRRRMSDGLYSCTFDSAGRWAVTDFDEGMIEFWRVDGPWVRTFPTPTSSVWSMAFTADGRWLATCPLSQPARLWPLKAAYGRPRDLVGTRPCACLATHPARDDILVGTAAGNVLLSPIAGGPPRTLPGGFGRMFMAFPVVFDPEGRRAIAGPCAAGRGIANPEQRALHVWDLDSGAERVYSVAHLTDTNWDANYGIDFAHDGSLYASLGSMGRIMRLSLPAEPGGEISAETVYEAGSAWSRLSEDGRFLLVHASDTSARYQFKYERLVLFDLVEGTSRRITTHGARLFAVSAVDPTGRILVTGDNDGTVRVGPITGSEPHLLLGHEGMVGSLAISPDGRWIASASDESIRLWPMPDETKPPLHTLPRDELLAKLDSFTNLHAVRDETSATGWKLDVGPFPGWQTGPSW